LKAWIAWALFFVAFIYNILDAYQTTLLLRLGATEANPMMGYFTTEYGVGALFVVKAIVFLGLGVCLLAHQNQFKRRILK